MELRSSVFPRYVQPIRTELPMVERQEWENQHRKTFIDELNANRSTDYSLNEDGSFTNDLQQPIASSGNQSRPPITYDNEAQADSLTSTINVEVNSVELLPLVVKQTQPRSIQAFVDIASFRVISPTINLYV